MDAGDYNVAIAFQERIKLPAEEMKYYENLAEMYVGTDVSPDFYAWVFPKYDHVAVGTGTMQQNQGLIKGLQEGIRERAKKRLVNGEVIAFDTPERVRSDPRVQEAYLGSVLAAHQADQAGHAERGD
jgi:flavin-dependent dehydrogenase